MSEARTPRALELSIGAAALFGVLLVLVSNIVVGERGLLGEVLYLLGFFTIWTNLAVAFVYTFGKRSAFIRGGTTTMIVMVGLVYHFMLSDGHSPDGALGTIGNLLTHYIIPFAVTGDWLVFGPRRGTKWIWALLWPFFALLYAVVAIARGSVTGFYSYPFLDINSLGVLGVAEELNTLMIAFAAAGLLVLAAARIIGHLRTVDADETRI